MSPGVLIPSIKLNRNVALVLFWKNELKCGDNGESGKVSYFHLTPQFKFWVFPWLSDIANILWIFDFEVNLYSLIIFNHVIAMSNFEVKMILNKIPTNNVLFKLDQSVFKIDFLWAKTFTFICAYFLEDLETTSFNCVVLLSLSCHFDQW